MEFVAKSTPTTSNITRSVSLFDSESESLSDLPALADASDCDSSDNGSFQLQLQLQLPANTKMSASVSVSSSPDRSVSSSSVRSESTTSSMNTPVRAAEFQPRIYGHGHGHGHNPDLSSSSSPSPSPIDAFIDASVSSSNVALASSTTTAATATGTASMSGTVSSAPKGQVQSLDRKIMLRGCASLLCVSDLLSSAWGEAEVEAEKDENNNDENGNGNGNVVTNNGTKSKSSESTSTRKLRSSSIDSIAAQHIIEHNILHHMCCSEAYSYWRQDKDTQEGGSGHVDDNDDDGDCNDCNDQHLPCDYFRSSADQSDSDRCQNENNRMDPIQRIGNRSVCMPKKARMRLKALRESGLGRDFSSANFSSYLQEGSDMNMNMNMAKIVQAEEEGLGMATGADHDPNMNMNTSIQHSDNDSSLYLIRQSKSLDMSKQEMQTRGKTLHSNNSNSSRSRSRSSTSFSYALFQCPVNVKKPSTSTRKANANANANAGSLESMGGTGVGLSNTRTGTGTGSSAISNESKSTIAQRQTMATMASVPSFDSLHSEVELFYDSDPGVERTRTRTPTCQSSSTSTVTCRAKHKSKNKKKKKNKNKKKTIHNHNLNETYTYTEHAINTNNTKLSLSRYKSSMASFDLESFDMNDTALVTELIQELGSGTYTFIWHPSNIHMESSNSNSNSNLQKNITLPPLRTRAWFEMGSCLKKTLVQPKFVWRTIVPSSMQSSRQQSINTIQAPEFVDLLNIVRIRLPSPESIDRGIHPFVRAENSFILISNTGDEYLFESKDEDTNRRFVLCTKLMIARLAAKIIVGDKHVFEEFFNPHGHGRRKDDKPPASVNSVRVVPATEQEKTPVALGHVNSVCSTLIAPVNEESGRNDELWGR